MKTKFVSVLVVFLLSISMTGCSLDRNEVPDANVSASPAATLDISNEISDTNTPTTPSASPSGGNGEDANAPAPSGNSAFEAYKAVLQGKAEFFSTDNQKELSLNDFLTNQEIYETIFEATQFAVLDMDGDKVPEVVLGLSVGNEPQFYEVLHTMNDTVYGYLFPIRGLQGLKTDGTFGYSSGAADSGFGKMKFETDTFQTDTLGYSESSQGETELTVSYFINNEPVTKEAFDSFASEQSAKEDVAWYEFSEENIEAELSVN